MIEFNGYISGNTEKHFWKKQAILGQNIMLISMLLCFPLPIVISIEFNNYYFLVAYLLIMLIMPLLCRIPKRKKEKIKYTPYRVYIEDGYITCCTKVQTEIKSLEDVKLVYDFGEWYSFVFPVGKKSNNFICQKNLLVKGTLEEFESIFRNKLVDKKNK